ncbi:MAG: HEAT repeat domain-containing protein [Granulosicoccus sp.]
MSGRRSNTHSFRRKFAATALGIGVFAVLIYPVRYSLPVVGHMLWHTHTSTIPDPRVTVPTLVREHANPSDASLMDIAEVSEFSSQISSVVPALRNTEGDKVSDVPAGENYVTKTLRLAREDPKFISTLFQDYLIQESANERHEIATQLAAIVVLSDSGENTERHIVNQALNDTDDAQRWSELLGRVGVRLPDLRQTLIDAIPLTKDGLVLGNLIKAILPVEASIDEKLAIVAQLEPFVIHEEPKVRAAAIRGVSMWGNQDQIFALEKGLRDPSNDVRHEAAAAAMMSDLRSDGVKASLLRIVADQSEPLDTREQAYFALSNYTLSESERMVLQRWEAGH